MKEIVLMLLLTLFIIGISCYTGDEILSKFHQNTFKLKDVRSDLVSYNKKYFNLYSFKTFKYNRTTTAFNVTLNMKVDMKDKIEVITQMYKFMSNEYRLFPVRFQVNIQHAFEANAVGAKNVQKCGNMSSFIFEKDVTYYTCNFVIDETHLPPLFPNGIFKVELKLTYLNEEIAVLNVFIEVYTPIDYPKNSKWHING